MARCLPFPPPKFVINGVSGEALLELIKVRRERAVAEKKRKEEKRRRKKKRKERKERVISENKSRRKHTKIKKCSDKIDCQLNRDKENQLLDRNNLTEELHRPISDSLYECSDNFQNVKGKRHCYSINGFPKYGSIIRDDLHLQDDKDPQVLSSMPVRPNKQLLHSSLQRTDTISDGKAKTASISNFSESCMDSVDSKYRELILNSVPPSIQIENSEFDNQDWIFERKLLRRNPTDISNAYLSDLHYRRCSVCPGAQHFNQADVYALPYTVLF